MYSVVLHAVRTEIHPNLIYPHVSMELKHED